MFNNTTDNQYDISNKVILDLTKDYVVKSRKQEAQESVLRWKAKTNLLENLSEQNAENLALMFDNEAKHCRKRILEESTQVSDMAGFNKIAFPLIRRIFAQLLANNIVSVQPMSWATGLLFYLDFVFDKARTGNTAGASIYGNRTTPVSGKMGGIGANDGTGGFYNYNQLGYAHRIFKLGASATTNASSTATGSTLTGTLSAFILSVSAGSDVMAAGELFVEKEANASYDTSSASAFRGFVGIDQFSNQAASSLSNCIEREMTQFISTSSVRVWANQSLTAANLSGTLLSVYGRVDTLLNDSSTSGGAVTNLGDFETTSFIPQINLKVLSTIITAETKKLKTVWTPEVAQDLNSYMSLDAEVELTNILSEQIAMEIDREIIMDLITVAAVKGAWSRKIGEYVYVDNTGSLARPTTTGMLSSSQGFYGGQAEWEATLGRVVSAVSARIHKLNLRKPANWMITSPEIATLFQNMDNKFLAPGLNDTTEKFTFGIEKIGNLDKMWDLYRDPYFPNGLILMGYKGDNPMECGYVWAPYIPLIVTPTIFDPSNFSPTKGVMTRNGKTAIRPDFYGTVNVLSMNFYGLQ